MLPLSTKHSNMPLFMKLLVSRYKVELMLPIPCPLLTLQFFFSFKKEMLKFLYYNPDLDLDFMLVTNVSEQKLINMCFMVSPGHMVLVCVLYSVV